MSVDLAQWLVIIASDLVAYVVWWHGRAVIDPHEFMAVLVRRPDGHTGVLDRCGFCDKLRSEHR